MVSVALIAGALVIAWLILLQRRALIPPPSPDASAGSFRELAETFSKQMAEMERQMEAMRVANDATNAPASEPAPPTDTPVPAHE